jgi:hypothetical protein
MIMRNLQVNRSLLVVALVLTVTGGCLLGGTEAGLGSPIDTGVDAEAVDASTDAIDAIDDAFASDAASRREPSQVDAAAVCPAICADAGVGTCNAAGTCAIDCVAAGTCIGPITCPPGIPCDVTCTGADSCMSSIDCSRASACTIKCIGAGSCKERISCSGTTCEVDCTGAATCLGGVCCDAGSCTGTPTACQ